MSNKKHELYLISFAFFLVAGLILFNVFNMPSITVKIKANDTTVYQAANSTDIIVTTNNTSQIVETMPKISVQDSQQSKAININTATVDELISLVGIGEIKAKSIVDYRNENGKFSSVDELINVSGIGEKTLEKIKNDITV